MLLVKVTEGTKGKGWMMFGNALSSLLVPVNKGTNEGDRRSLVRKPNASSKVEDGKLPYAEVAKQKPDTSMDGRTDGQLSHGGRENLGGGVHGKEVGENQGDSNFQLTICWKEGVEKCFWALERSISYQPKAYKSLGPNVSEHRPRRGVKVLGNRGRRHPQHPHEPSLSTKKQKEASPLKERNGGNTA